MDTATDAGLRLEAPALRGVVALEACDMTIATEFRWIVNAGALHRDGELSHLFEVYRITILHVELHCVEEFAQHEPHVRGLCRAVLFDHLLDLVERNRSFSHRVGIVLIVVLAALDLVLDQSVLNCHSLFFGAKIIIYFDTTKGLVYKFTEIAS